MEFIFLVDFGSTEWKFCNVLFTDDGDVFVLMIFSFLEFSDFLYLFLAIFSVRHGPNAHNADFLIRNARGQHLGAENVSAHWNGSTRN